MMIFMILIMIMMIVMIMMTMIIIMIMMKCYLEESVKSSQELVQVMPRHGHKWKAFLKIMIYFAGPLSALIIYFAGPCQP